MYIYIYIQQTCSVHPWLKPRLAKLCAGAAFEEHLVQTASKDVLCVSCSTDLHRYYVSSNDFDDSKQARTFLFGSDAGPADISFCVPTHMQKSWSEMCTYMFPANPTFAHTQITHPNNIIYSSPGDEWKHWLYAAILTLGFQDLEF